MAVTQQNEIPSGEGLTLEKLWAYHFASKAEADERQREYDRRWQEAEARREKAEARREKDEAMRRKEDAKREAARQAEDAKRREEEAKREAARQAEDAKRREEDERRQAKKDAEWKKLMDAFDKTEKLVMANNQNVGGLNRSFGKLVEHLVGPGILNRFDEYGYHFADIKKRRHKLYDESGNEETEIDILLENNDTVIAVEVKSRPNREETYLGRHLLRLEIMREHAKKEGWENKRILGAIAGAIFDTSVRNATLKAGLFVIEQSGDTMKMDVPKGFKPREW